MDQESKNQYSLTSGKISYYQRVLIEELLRTFPFGHHSRQSGV